MKQENMKRNLEQRTDYEVPALTTVSFRTEKGFAASGVQDYVIEEPDTW